MTISAIQKKAVVIKIKQLLQLKGGANDQHSTDIIIIDDVDTF